MPQDPAPERPADSGSKPSADAVIQQTLGRLYGTTQTEPVPGVQSMRWLLECAEERSPTAIRQLQDSLLLLRAAVEDTILFANRLHDPRREDVKAAAMKAAGEANESQEWKAAEDHLSGKMPKSGDFAYETRLLIATIWDGLYDCWQGRKVRPPLGQLGDWRAALDQRLRALQAIGEPAAGAMLPKTNPPMHPTFERIEPGSGATPGAASHSQSRRGANEAGLAAIVERANTMWDRLEGCQDGGRVSLFAAQELFGELITILRAVLDSLPNDPTQPISSEVKQICDALKAAPLDEVAFCFGMLGQSSTAYTVFVHNPTRATAADALAACTDVFWLINRLHHTNPSSPTADDNSPTAKPDRAARRAEQQTPSEAGGDNLEYQPVHWFPQSLADRLRQATRKTRKGKRVRSKRVDGVVLYCVADAKCWWPRDFQNRQRDGA